MSIITNEILIPKKVFGAKVDKELELDAQLPDYCPDIARLVKVDCTPFTESYSIEEGKATMRGKAVFDILYETDYKSRLTCCSMTQDFEITVPIPRTDTQNESVLCSAECLRISCRLISPRRLMIKSTLNGIFDVEGELSLNAIAVKEDENTFFRKKTIGFEGRTSLYTDEFGFSDMLQLNQGEKNINEIVGGSITLQPPQIVVSSGKAEIRSTAVVRALCEEEENDGKYYVAVKTLPVIIDFKNDAIEDFKRVSAELAAEDVSLSPELDQYGESRVIKTTFNVKANIRLNEPKAYTVADDVFETGYDSVAVIEKAIIPTIYSQQELSFTSESKFNDITPAPSSILDAYARTVNSTAERADGGITLSGSFAVTLMTNTEQGIFSIDRSVPYSQFFSLDLPNGELMITADTTPIEVIPTLHSDGTASVRIISTARIGVCGQQEESFVSELSKRTPVQKESDGATLVYCFPKKQERLWDIAKLYRTDPERIANANPKAFDEKGLPLSPDKPILIRC